MSKPTLELVEEFHKSFNLPLGRNPTANPPDAELRLDLLQEELNELAEAIKDDDPVEVLDALLDLQYVLDGTFLAFGMETHKEAGFLEVHKSNMSKLGTNGKPIYREDGKVLKGPDFFRPNLKSVLYDY